MVCEVESRPKVCDPNLVFFYFDKLFFMNCYNGALLLSK